MVTVNIVSESLDEDRPLRVLMVHNHYLVRGGEDASFAAECELLRSGGHKVEVYVRENEEIEEQGRLRTAAGTFWSRQSRRKVAGMLEAGSFDVLHVQNSFPLISPSVYGAAREAGVAVVQTLRNYRPLCANALLMRAGGNCELCLGKTVGWSGLRHRCYRGSLLGSAVVVGMNALHKLRATYPREVNRFIVAAEVVRQKFLEGGFPEERIRVKPNVVPDLPNMQPGPRQKRAIYVGRYSEEKGVVPLLRSWLEGGIKVPLVMVGSGPLEEQLRHMAAGNPLVTFAGRLPVEEACREVAESELLVLPTQCYETFGRTVLEAYAMGTAVISSRGTAPGSLVREEETGYLVESGDVESLTAAIKRFFGLPVKSRRAMGERGLELYQDHFHRRGNLELLTAIYREAIADVAAGKGEK